MRASQVERALGTRPEMLHTCARKFKNEAAEAFRGSGNGKLTSTAFFARESR